MPRNPSRVEIEAFMHVAAGAQVQVFAMLNERHIERAREFHGVAHHASVHHGFAIVGDGDDAGLLHGSKSRRVLRRRCPW